jgi:hypothetical protein
MLVPQHGRESLNLWQVVKQASETPLQPSGKRGFSGADFEHAPQRRIIYMRLGYCLTATSSNAMAVATQRAKIAVLRATRIAPLSINQLYFASIVRLLGESVALGLPHSVTDSISMHDIRTGGQKVPKPFCRKV